MQPSGFRPNKTCAASFLNSFKNIPGKGCVKRVYNILRRLEISIREKHYTAHTNKEEVLSGFKTSARDRPFDRSMGL